MSGHFLADMESAPTDSAKRFLLVVLHSCVDRAGAVELFGQNKTRQLVRQRDASQADAGLCGALDAVVQPVGGADDKRISLRRSWRGLQS